MHKKIQNIFTLFGVCAPLDDTANHAKYRYILTGAMVPTVLLAAVCSSVASATKSDDFNTLLSSISQSFILFCSAFTMLIGFSFRDDLKRLFSRLQQNYDKCNRLAQRWVVFFKLISWFWWFAVKNDESIIHLDKADRVGGKVTTILVKYVVYGVISSFTLMAVSNLIQVYLQAGYIDTDQLVCFHSYVYVTKKAKFNQ